MADLYNINVSDAHANLREIATTASTGATTFQSFASALKQDTAEIRDVIAKCFTIYEKLDRLADILLHLTGGRLRRYERYTLDIWRCALSLKYTFEDIDAITGHEFIVARDIGLPRNSATAYRRVWDRINEKLMRQSGNRLARRLEYGVEFLNMLEASLEGSKGPYPLPVDQVRFDDLSRHVESLFNKQEENQLSAGTRPNILDYSPSPSPPNTTSLSKTPSFERNRPLMPIYPYPVTSPPLHAYQRPQRPARRPSINSFASSSSTSNFNRAPPRSPHKPPRSSFSSGGHMAEPGWEPPGYYRISGGMPPAPEVPGIGGLRSPSPSSSVYESSEMASWSSEDSAFGADEAAAREEPGGKAWVSKVFERSPAASRLPATGRSACFDYEINDADGMKQKLRREYNELTELKFEHGEITVRIYQRHHDCRVHFFLRTQQPHKRSEICIVSLTSLTVSRQGPLLKFEKLDHGVRRDWAHLRFRTYEELTIFHTLFLALRSMDKSSHRLSRSIRDASPLPHDDSPFHHDESCHFAKPIIDDHYHNTLSILSDRDTGAVRLLSSARDGPLKRTPFWTAYVTHLMYSPGWMRRVTAKAVHLAELDVYIFSEDYTRTTVAEGGRAGVELMFLRQEDADAFIGTLAALASPPVKSKSKDKPKSKDKSAKDDKKEVKFDKAHKDDKGGKGGKSKGGGGGGGGGKSKGCGCGGGGGKKERGGENDGRRK